VSLRTCPALFIAAPASGQGKTTITAALARYHRDRSRRVRVFKTGPDFLDPMILERASDAPVYQLDLWMGGEDHCRQLLYEAAGEADLILIEGAMGLFDGEPSSADLAALLGIPVLAVIDGSAMAQTFGALAHGLATYRPGLLFAGVMANRVAGERHYEMLAASLPSGLTAFGWLPGDKEIALPERHLGLVGAAEIGDLEHRIARAAAVLNGVSETLPRPATFALPVAMSHAALLQNVRIAVARDDAFAFLYRANLDLLTGLGAELTFFSPLDDETLPSADALYLPGGYPELHLDRLGSNKAMKTAIRHFHCAGKPIVAECGGMLYLADSLSDIQGRCAEMVGLLPGRATMRERLVNIGLHGAHLPEGELKGHTFHYSTMMGGTRPIIHSRAARHHGTAEPVYRKGRLTASYLHWYFPSNATATARLFLP
jgi:cobyrinic acid a,c-diamide synthase